MSEESREHDLWRVVAGSFIALRAAAQRGSAHLYDEKEAVLEVLAALPYAARALYRESTLEQEQEAVRRVHYAAQWLPEGHPLKMAPAMVRGAAPAGGEAAPNPSDRDDVALHLIAEAYRLFEEKWEDGSPRALRETVSIAELLDGAPMALRRPSEMMSFGGDALSDVVAASSSLRVDLSTWLRRELETIGADLEEAACLLTPEKRLHVEWAHLEHQARRGSEGDVGPVVRWYEEAAGGGTPVSSLLGYEETLRRVLAAAGQSGEESEIFAALAPENPERSVTDLTELAQILAAER